MAEGGYDTASYIYDVQAAAVTKYGTPTYWLRYFSPSVNGTVNQSSSHSILECRAAWDSGGKHLMPISGPTQSRLGGSAAQGQADAQALVASIVNVYGWVAPLHLPTNNVLRVWLDQETGTSMSTSYWGAWSAYINSYNWFGLGVFPLFACLYCNPCGGAGHNCTTVGTAGGCFSIWSSEPETPYCGNSLKNLPSWHANSCAACQTNAPATSLWQFSERNVCGLTVNVDMDTGTLSPNSLYLSARP
jgi:hypothetical protein